MSVRHGVLWLLAGLALAGGLRAEMEDLRTAFLRGQALERSKHYQEAIQAYQAALAASPQYVYSWRQIGNCRYYLGDPDGALQAYDRYLKYHPEDTRTQAFADRLRGEQPDLTPLTPQDRRRRWPRVPPLRLALDVGLHTVSFRAWNDYWKSYSWSSSSTLPTIESAVSVGGVVGYRVLPRLELGLDVDYFLVDARVYISSYASNYSSTQDITYSYNALWVGPFVNYDILVLRKAAFNVGAGVGYFSLMNADSENTFKSTSYSYYYPYTTTYSSSFNRVDYSGSTVGLRAGGAFDWRFSQHVGFSFSLAYRLASIGKVTGTDKNGSATLKDVIGGDLALDYSGVDFRSALNLRF